jgi:O-antigen/teichoic acid export membrane protein
MFRNILQSLFTKGFVAIINFIILIVSSRYLGVSSRGEISILVLNISIIQIVNEVFTGYTLVYFIPRFNLRKIYFAGAIYTLLACSLSNSIFYVLKEHIPGYEFLSFLISLVVIMNTFNCVIILGRELISWYNFLNVIQPVLLMAGLSYCTLYLKNFTFASYVWPLLTSFAIAFLISSAVVFRQLKLKQAYTDFALKPILSNGFLCQLAVLMHVFCNRYSYYLLGEKADVGLYSSASSLIESVLIISNGIAPVLLSRVANSGDSERSRRMTLGLAKASFLLSIFCVFVIALLPDKFFTMILGEGFIGIKKIMLLYSPGILALSFAGMISHYFSATGKLKIILFCNGMGFLFAMVLAHILIPQYRLTGAAISADVSYSVLTICLIFVFLRKGKQEIKSLFTIQKDFQELRELFFTRNKA